ncbi:MAG: LITAF-like zinc ribbon domain-containing protein [Pirellulales bacterium]|nr:LITAF-like zinc ribbon domain-containing protein [Pirellulales bacterium]
MSFKCPFCSHEGPPEIKREMSMGGWVLFIVLLLFCIPLCWLPFVIDGCKEDKRICSGCGAKLG